VAQAAEELTRLSALAAPRDDGRITPALLFRGTTAGERVGPHVSQFLWKEAPYGSMRLVPQVRTATPGLDYLTTFEDWLAVQNGVPATPRHAGAYRYLRSGRDLAAYVGLDFSYQACLTAALVLFGMQGTTDAQRPYKGAPFDPANPYRTSRTQTGFVTLGVVEALDLVTRVAALALAPAWFQKWMVHRRLRPEELGGRVHRLKTGAGQSPIHHSLLASAALDLTFERHGSYLLPQAYPEGCPLHPSYPAGHAVVAGAGATVLKAFFDEAFPVDDPVEPTADGLALKPWAGPPLTVGGELDKLAGNVAYGRGWAGIHWRSDSAAGLALGEEVALAVLAERRRLLPEPFRGFSLTRFDGTRVVV
jgi:membrane-associated phospholipid phosphatase